MWFVLWLLLVWLLLLLLWLWGCPPAPTGGREGAPPKGVLATLSPNTPAPPPTPVPTAADWERECAGRASGRSSRLL